MWILVPGLLPHLPVKYRVSNVGYYLNGNKRRQCLATGSWSDSTPSCKIYMVSKLATVLINGNKKRLVPGL